MRQVLIIGLVLLIASCTKKELVPEEPVLTLSPETAPFELTDSTAKFFEDIFYNEDTLTVFDFFMPDNSIPSSLCIMIHGGGFLHGDKSLYYSNTFYRSLINKLMENNVAVATINYRFVEDGETEGLIKSLQDAKRAVQFIRYYAGSLHIDKQNVVLFGGSAGAGTSLWIGLSDEMADDDSPDPVSHESTRVQGIAGFSPQASYDILEWHNSVFSEYLDEGFDYESIKSIMSEELILKYFGVNDSAELYSDVMIAYRNKIDLLNLMTADDPEIYMATSNIPYTVPLSKSELYHHPLHVKALWNMANQSNTKAVFYCPEIELDTRNGETVYDFILRRTGN